MNNKNNFKFNFNFQIFNLIYIFFFYIFIKYFKLIEILVKGHFESVEIDFDKISTLKYLEPIFF
jgi:hypothetical protein